MADQERWEYQGLEFSRVDLLGVRQHIDQYGAAGWEVAAMVPSPSADGSEYYLVLMKRKLVD